MTTRNAVSPADGSFCYAHEHNWPTGREPWRCPVLKVYDKDGALQHHLYDWGGPFVGLGEMRLVSDTAIRAATYDKDGNLIITLWSDGGNSVALREPMDVYRVSPNIKGLGMSSWGAGVLSLAYIIKLDGKTFRVASGTIWSAYLKDRDKPNSIWVDAMGFGAEGSTLMGGRSATGLIQTGNNLNPYTKADPTVVPSGTYVAVMGPDFASLRFSSGMPNCGATDLANGKPWAFRTGTVNGKPLALVMGGATGKNADGYTAPMVNPLQPAFGGGLTDGHVLVLDLSQAQ
jgi:3D (Asp-Asp-Asp) domain-containing protein